LAEDKGTGLLGIDELENCDAVILFTRRVTLPEAELARLKKYCDAGKPVIGIRTASHAFQNWPEIDKQLFGGDYRGHFKADHVADVTLVARDHPVLAGLRAFKTSGKLYKNPQPAADITLLLSATNEEGKPEPVAWTREQRGGRVFYTSLGVPADFENPNFLRLLTNAIFWTAKRPLPSTP
ncbi:MAG: ThuA domain-containing protein, partial [Verrucomicrobiota bacterium]|nr:ThuA domain-containing protein [Verrucomicrobiota bacterium]